MTDAEPRVFFSAELAPNRPLAARWIALIIALVAAMSFFAGIGFVLRGAWPVTPFFGADVALLGLALHMNAKAARKREHILLTRDVFEVRRVDVKGREARVSLNPYWARVEHEDPERLGHELAVVSRGQRVVVGGFLGAEARCALADALRTALRESKTAPP